MFEKVNVKTYVCGPSGTTVVVPVAVTVACISSTAGASMGTRTARATNVTQVITRTLVTSCLFKCVLSRCWV
jgi:hypothetical protein